MSQFYIDPDAVIERGAKISQNVQVLQGAHIRAGAALLSDVYIGEGSDIGMGSRVEQRAVVGPNVYVGAFALILEDAVVCPHYVRSASSDGRRLQERVMVGRGVLLHDEVELGHDAIVPTQATIAHIGSLGRKNRVVTIYGSDEGARVSLGCNVGVSCDDIRSNVLENAKAPDTHTTQASAASYVPYLPVFNQVGAIVQHAYDREAQLVEEMKGRWTEFIASYQDRRR